MKLLSIIFTAVLFFFFAAPTPYYLETNGHLVYAETYMPSSNGYLNVEAGEETLTSPFLNGGKCGNDVRCTRLIAIIPYSVCGEVQLVSGEAGGWSVRNLPASVTVPCEKLIFLPVGFN